MPDFQFLDTKLRPDQERKYMVWKGMYAPEDSGEDYDLRGAFLEGFKPDPQTGHWPDKYKKPNHPTFSNESKFAREYPELAGHWNGEEYVKPMPDIEIVDNIFQPQENPHEDRITAILQKRAQPQSYTPQQVNQATEAAQYSALAGRNAGVEQILEAIVRKPQFEQQNTELQSAQGLYDLFEQKRSSGDKQAQMLFDKISLFTGGDPEGGAMFLEQLQNDPEDIDPSNSFQVMSKLAAIAKRSGYSSPESQLSKLKIKQAQKELNRPDEVDIPANYREYLLTQQDPGFADFLKTRKSKAMPAAALKLQEEGLDIVGTASGMNERLQKVIDQVSQGKLEVGPFKNIISSGLNAAGFSTENSRNYASFISNLEKLRNDSLRLNKGVQTEGDAVRAWNEILSNVNDEELVKQRLGEVQEINRRAAELQKLNVNQIRINYGNDPMDFSQYEKSVPAGASDDNSDLINYMTPEERALFGK